MAKDIIPVIQKNQDEWKKVAADNLPFKDELRAHVNQTNHKMKAEETSKSFPHYCLSLNWSFEVRMSYFHPMACNQREAYCFFFFSCEC